MRVVDAWTAGTGAAGRLPLRIATWNVLSEALETDNGPGQGDNVRRWDNRKMMLIAEMLRLQADILCLQEVDNFSFFSEQLARHYSGFWIPKTKWPTCRIEDDGTVHTVETFLAKHSGTKSEQQLLEEWKSLKVYKTTEGQAIFVRTDVWRVRRWLCFHAFPLALKKGRGLGGSWMKWVGQSPRDLQDMMFFCCPERIRELRLKVLLNDDDTCPLPQVALGAEIIPAYCDDDIPRACVLNLHLKSNPRSIAKSFGRIRQRELNDFLKSGGQLYDWEFAHRIKRAQFQLFVDEARAVVGASVPLVVTGDFNQSVSPDDLCQLRLCDMHSGLPPPTDKLKIDFILCDDRAELVAGEVLTTRIFGSTLIPNALYPSDHVAFAACVTLCSQQPVAEQLVEDGRASVDERTRHAQRGDIQDDSQAGSLQGMPRKGLREMGSIAGMPPGAAPTPQTDAKTAAQRKNEREKEQRHAQTERKEAERSKPVVESWDRDDVAPAAVSQGTSKRPLEKKLRQIAGLEARIAHGEALGEDQLAKVASKAQLQAELARLRRGEAPPCRADSPEAPPPAAEAAAAAPAPAPSRKALEKKLNRDNRT